MFGPMLGVSALKAVFWQCRSAATTLCWWLFFGVMPMAHGRWSHAPRPVVVCPLAAGHMPHGRGPLAKLRAAHALAQPTPVHKPPYAAPLWPEAIAGDERP